MAIAPNPKLFPEHNPALQLPPDFATNRMCEPSLALDCAGYSYLSLTGTKTVPGLRYTFGPICWEEFETREEPKPTDDGPKRLVFWHPFTHETEPKKPWKHFPIPLSQSSVKQWGYVALEQPESYSDAWSNHARRHQKKWLAQDAWRIEEVPLEAFLKAYRHSPKDLLLITLFSNLLKNKARTHGSLLRLFGAKKNGSEEIKAGFAALDTPEIKNSLHFISFICPEAQKDSVGVGLVDHWFRHGFANGFRFLNFGAFWAPGNPKEWIGFSNFKAQFGTRLYTKPPSVHAWVGSLKETFKRKQKNIL